MVGKILEIEVKKLSQEYCKNNSEAQRKAAPNIRCFDFKTGELIKIYCSAINAAEDLFINAKVRLATIASRICTVCLYNKGHAYGFI